MMENTYVTAMPDAEIRVGLRIALYIKASRLISFNCRVAHLSALFTSWIEREPIQRCLCPVD